MSKQGDGAPTGAEEGEKVMDFLALSLRMANGNGAIYAPYSFDVFQAEWNDGEQDAIATAIAPHVPEKVSATFNNWLFTKYRNGYTIRRATWERGQFRATLDEVVTFVSEYYGRSA